MKRAAIFLLLATSCFAAGVVRQNSQVVGNGISAITFNWTGDPSTGSVPNTLAAPSFNFQGQRILVVEITPLNPPPTNGYNVLLVDSAGVDLLAGAGFAQSASTAAAVNASNVTPPLFGSFTLQISGQTVAGAVGIVTVYLAPIQQMFGVVGNATGGGGGGSSVPCTSVNLSLQYNNAGALGCVPDLTFSSPHTLLMGPLGSLDLRSGGSNGLGIPAGTGVVPTADGFIGNYTTNHTLVFGSNGQTSVAALAGATASTINTDCRPGNQVVTVISAINAPTCTSLTNSYLPTATVYNNQTNAYAAFLQDFSLSPFKVWTNSADPACSAGELEFNSTGTVFKGCTAANTWVTFASNGGVSSISPGSLTGAVTLSGGTYLTANQTSQTITIDANTALLLTQLTAQTGTPWNATDAGASGNTYTATTVPSFSSYTSPSQDKMRLAFTCNTTFAGGSTTLNVNGIGSKQVYVRVDGKNPGPSDCVAGQTKWVTYQASANGSVGAFIMEAPSTVPSDPKIYPAANCINGTAGSAWSASVASPAACRAGTNNLNGVWSVIPATGITAYIGNWEIPLDWVAAAQPFVAVYYGSGANTSGTVIWTISTACTKGDGSITDDPAWVAESAMGTQTMAVANRMWQQSAQFANVTSSNNCIPGGTMFVKAVLSGTAASAINIDKIVIGSAGRLPVAGQAN